jgi:23S rRNA (guanosine2251-2'-O)-methyltransferase
MEQTVLEGYNSITSCMKAESRNIYKILIDNTLIKRKPQGLRPLKTKAEKLNIEIEYVDASIINELATGKTHGGVIALCGERKYASLDSLLKSNPNSFFVYLEGIEDPFNFGQAIRAIYASGADAVLLPKRNWMSASATVGRASAGASELIHAALIEADDLHKLKEHGYKIVCADLSESAKNFTEANLKKPIVLVIGGEKRGISSTITNLCDETVEISYGRDFRQSLGASEAAAILSFEVLRQNK